MNPTSSIERKHEIWIELQGSIHESSKFIQITIVPTENKSSMGQCDWVVLTQFDGTDCDTFGSDKFLRGIGKPPMRPASIVASRRQAVRGTEFGIEIYRSEK